MNESFIEKQFPVSKISKESYKERKAGAGQTLTGLGKWWGRKPLILVRATILGCLMPASNNAEKDKEIFLKILSMDDDGLLMRKEKKLSTKDLYSVIHNNKELKEKYEDYFLINDSGKVVIDKSAPKKEIEIEAFKSLGYDAKIALCKRPEQLKNVSENSWKEINDHLGTNATSLTELINQLSIKRYGHLIKVGDCFCGGGSIPFEAARMGCETFGSDLNPVATMLTWAGINLCGSTSEEMARLNDFRNNVYKNVCHEIDALGIEQNEVGDKAVAYLYCEEAQCPECGHRIPLSPSWVIGKTSKTVAKLIETKNGYTFEVKSNASHQEMQEAEKGTITKNGMLCPHCKKTTAISTLRRDKVDSNGNTIYGLRLWGHDEFVAHQNDIFNERLYAVKYEKSDGTRYYRSPNSRDIDNEKKILDIVSQKFIHWKKSGFVPSMTIETGYNTSQLIHERGWSCWHQLFNPRQLLLIKLFVDNVFKIAKNKKEFVIGMLGIMKIADWNSKLCIWINDDNHPNTHTFYNQALNPLYNFGVRSTLTIPTIWNFDIKAYSTNDEQSNVKLSDARVIDQKNDFWITDPPYADAVNYHELTEFFLAWNKTLIPKAFPEWYTDSKRILAVRGDKSFSQTMIDIYSNLTKNMNNNGLQVVMFTHSDPAVWAQLALIMWKSGLTVTAAWNIATETESGGLKNGNYVKGTVLLVLRKQTSEEEAFLDELTSDIKNEVKKQINYMQTLDDKEDPNFSDPDYVLAAYAASLKVLTGYKAIGEIDLDYELNLAINDPTKSEVVKLIERAKKIAYDFIIPTNFDPHIWKELNPTEKFYIKGLEAEKHGDKKISTYQEYARGFNMKSYDSMMGCNKANEARLKTPTEFEMKTVYDVTEFNDSLLHKILQSIYAAISENDNAQKGLGHLKTTISDYWSKREIIKHLLARLIECKDIDYMPHWKKCGEIAESIYILVDNDKI